MKQEILPCPICNSTNSRYNEYKKTRNRIECGDCSHLGPGERDETEAIRVWNNSKRGVTTRQMKEAPTDSIYVWSGSKISYPKELAKFLGREDLRIVGRDYTKRFSHMRYHRDTPQDALRTDQCIFDHRVLLTAEEVKQYITRPRTEYVVSILRTTYALTEVNIITDTPESAAAIALTKCGQCEFTNRDSVYDVESVIKTP